MVSEKEMAEYLLVQEKEMAEYWGRGMNGLKLLLDTLDLVKKQLERDYHDGNFDMNKNAELRKLINHYLLLEEVV